MCIGVSYLDGLDFYGEFAHLLPKSTQRALRSASASVGLWGMEEPLTEESGLASEDQSQDRRAIAT